jgi:type I restriction enzyme M protein
VIIQSGLPMEADVKGDIYEGLLAKSAAESPKGAGQYFTPRELIKAIVDVMQPKPDDTIDDLENALQQLRGVAAELKA